MTGSAISVELIGSEQQPVVVIDDFAPRPDTLVNDAGMLSFAPMGIHYPGIRANIARRMLTPLLTPLVSTIADVFGYVATEITDAFYSLVTTPPDALTPIQRIPHFDGVEPSRLALLHYLAPDAPGGTAFYRHRSTGYDSVTVERLPSYRSMLDADFANAGLPPPAYIDGDTDIFEQIARFEGRFNRAILYRGNSLHCAWLPEGTALTADPAAGRLTANIFLEGS
jgi:Family of unknown function (DUF6445)